MGRFWKINIFQKNRLENLDFEKYALQRPMDGLISDLYQIYFNQWIDYRNSHLKILDFGCGDGKYFIFFRQFFKEENIYGIEISKIRVERCKSIGWENVFLIERMKPLPFPDNFFDLINFDQVIEHIPKYKINFYLSEIVRVLKRGGKMIIITPNYPIKRVYDLMNFLKGNHRMLFDDLTHITHYNFNKLESLLKKYFTKVELMPTGGLFYRFFRKNFLSHKIIGLCIK